MDKNKFEQKYMEKSWKKSKNPYQQFVIDDSVKNFSKFLISRKVKGSLLDIGCGNGKNAVFFSKKGFDSKGIDFSNEAIRIAKRHAKYRHSKAAFAVVDVTKKNDLGKFDVVIDCGCLHHIRKRYWKKYLRNILSSTKQGSYFYIHGFTKEIGKKHTRNWRVRKGHYTRLFSDVELRKLFGKHFRLMKSYDFKSQSGKFIVGAYYFLRK